MHFFTPSVISKKANDPKQFILFEDIESLSANVSLPSLILSVFILLKGIVGRLL